MMEAVPRMMLVALVSLAEPAPSSVAAAEMLDPGAGDRHRLLRRSLRTAAGSAVPVGITITSVNRDALGDDWTAAADWFSRAPCVIGWAGTAPGTRAAVGLSIAGGSAGRLYAASGGLYPGSGLDGPVVVTAALGATGATRATTG